MKLQWNLRGVSDDELITQLGALVRDEHRLLADVLAHMAEVDARALYYERSFPSMFQYSIEELGLSEAAARRRITAARLVQRYPSILQRVAHGEIHLSGLCVLAPHLKEHNCRELLDAATHCSRRQIEELIATRFPKPDVPATITPIDSEGAAASHDHAASSSAAL